MKKITLISILLLGFVGTSFAQGCLPDGITFSTQEQIDNFQTNYPGCTEIEGGVEVSGNDITNLNGLSVITTIGGHLGINYNYDLTSLAGLENLTSIGVAVVISENYNLSTLSGLANLTLIEGKLIIRDNDALTSLTGLDNLTSVANELTIWGNNSLQSLSGLNNLTNVYGFVSIHGNPLTNFEGLGKLKSIDGDFYIYGNSSMTSITGLDSLTIVNGELYIGTLNSLTSLSGLEKINPDFITDLVISDNDLLSECDIENICEYLAAGIGYVEIEANAPGCNNQEQVEEACALAIGENKIISNINISPNPFIQEIIIDFELMKPVSVELAIYNNLGVEIYKIIEQKYQGHQEINWKSENLPSGIYFCVIKTNNGIQTTKMIKL